MKILRTVFLIGFTFVFYYGIAFLLHIVIPTPVPLTLITDLIMIIGFMSYRFSKKEPKQEKKTVRPSLFFTYIAFFLFLFFTCTFLGNYVYELFPKDSAVQYSASLSQSPMYLQLLLTLLVAPVTEELFIRDFVYKQLCKVSPIIVAASISSVLFAVAHGTTIQAVTGFISGMFFAFVYETFQDIRYPILFHILYNLIVIVMANVSYPSFCFQMPFVGILTILLFFGFILIYFIVESENKNV